MRKVVVLGASAGGIEAFCTLLKGLPADFPAPLLAVIHIGEGEKYAGRGAATLHAAAGAQAQ